MKTAWVTGGGTGIGRALAEALCREGFQVAISGRRAEVLDEAARQITAAVPKAEVLPLRGNLADPAACSALAESVLARWGGLDLLINNAGQNPSRGFFETPPEEYLQLFEVNCLSAVRCTTAVLPAMRKRGRGAIVNVSSVYGKWGSANSPSYSVSKYALAGYTDVLRQALIGSGIHVMGVYPGYIRTPMTQPFVKEGSAKEKLGASPESMARAILNGLRRRRTEVAFPWYVPLAVGWHRWMPRVSDKLARSFRGRTEKR